MFHDLQAAEVWCNMDLGVLGPIWQKYGKYENAMEKNKQSRIFWKRAKRLERGWIPALVWSFQRPQRVADPENPIPLNNEICRP